MSGVSFHLDVEAAQTSRLVRTAVSVMLGALAGWGVRELVPGLSIGVLLAALSVGLLAARIDRESRWTDVLGTLVLIGGAAALGGRLVSAGQPLLAWPVFALALTAAGVGSQTGRLRGALMGVGFALVLPLLDLVCGQGAPVRGVLLAGLTLAVGAWALRGVRLRVSRAGSAPYVSAGPYRSR